MTATVPASIRRAAAEATLDLPFRVPAQEWFSLPQAARVLGLSLSMVEKLYEQGALTGHSHNAGAGARKHARVLRISLLAYLHRTADYTDASITETLVAALRRLPPEMLAGLARHAARSA